MSKINGLKFCDIVLNEHASERNPHRIGFFVRFRRNTIELTDGKGYFWEIINDKDSKLKKVIK